jgi:hypothetical protein
VIVVAPHNFELSYTRAAVPPPWNASIDQYCEAATSVVSSIGATLNLATGAMSAVSSIGNLLKSATGASYFAYPPVVTASEFLSAVIPESANSTDQGQVVAESDSIKETLGQYANLKDGWLNERSSSKAPGFVAVTRARKLYESTKSNGYPPVRCYVSADGEVGLIWRKGRGYGNVGFWSDGSLVYYVRRTDGAELRDDIVMDGENLPGELIKALRTF